MSKLTLKLEHDKESKGEYHRDVNLEIEVKADATLSEILHAFKLFLNIMTYSSSEVISNDSSVDVIGNKTKYSASSEEFMN